MARPWSLAEDGGGWPDGSPKESDFLLSLHWPINILCWSWWRIDKAWSRIVAGYEEKSLYLGGTPGSSGETTVDISSPF